MNDNTSPSVEIESNEGPIWIFSDWRHKELCKQVPGSKWDAEQKLWRVPLSWAACKQLRGIFGEQLLVGDNLRAWAQRELEGRISPAMQLRLATSLSIAMRTGDGLEPAFAYDPKLYGFQEAGIAFTIVAQNSLLCDEMGTGKTVQLMYVLRELHRRSVEEDRPDLSPYPCLVVAPNSVKTVWRREGKVWNPDASVEIVQGSAAKRRAAISSGADIVIINYESAWRHSKLAAYGNVRLTDADKEPKELNEVGWRTVILDEAHRCKNPKAKQTRACWALGEGKTVVRRHALTGTPVANTPDDMWSLLHFCDPKEWPARTKFVDRYCLMAWNPFGGMDVVGVRPENKEELFSIIDPRMRRMPKDLVLPFLPPKRRSVRETEMTAKQAKAYKQMETTQVAELEQAIAESDNPSFTAATLPIVQRIRLMQFSSSYAYINDDADVKLDFPSNKVDEFMDFVDELPADEPVVAFAESRQLITLLGQKLEDKHAHAKCGPVRYIVGGMTADQREAATEDFQAGRAQYILCTIKAGGEGITLTRASQCVFLQRSDSMIGNKQAEDRVHRIGSEVHDSIHLVDFIAPGTVEEAQVENLLVKLGRLEEIVRDRATLQAAADGGDAGAIAKLAQLADEESAILADDSTIRATL